MSAVADFVRTYTPQSEAHIAFAWNGKHANEFVDSNMQFRKDVCSYFEAEQDTFSLPLIAALFKAETLCAKEAWGVNRVVSKLAQELLERGGVEYLEVYMDGAKCGMDAFIATGAITLSKIRCQELLDRCTENATATDGTEKAWAMLAERFSSISCEVIPGDERAPSVCAASASSSTDASAESIATNTPDFTKYDEVQLRQILTRIDQSRFPERVKMIEGRLIGLKNKDSEIPKKTYNEILMDTLTKTLSERYAESSKEDKLIYNTIIASIVAIIVILNFIA